MSKKNNLYLGRAGQFFVMSEFLYGGWNVAIPEVDAGDDIFVVRDENGDFWRVQVKTTSGKALQRGGINAKFNVPLAQLKTKYTPDLIYVFVIRYQSHWKNFIVIRREELETKIEEKITLPPGKTVGLSFSLKGKELLCRRVDFFDYLQNFDDFPIINH